MRPRSSRTVQSVKAEIRKPTKSIVPVVLNSVFLGLLFIMSSIALGFSSYNLDRLDRNMYGCAHYKGSHDLELFDPNDNDVIFSQTASMTLDADNDLTLRVEMDTDHEFMSATQLNKLLARIGGGTLPDPLTMTPLNVNRVTSSNEYRQVEFHTATDAYHVNLECERGTGSLSVRSRIGADKFVLTAPVKISKN